MSEKIKNSLKNFEKALSELNEYLNTPVISKRDRAGVIKAFEFTFEVMWKTLKKIADDEGLVAGGPKSTLSCAFQMDIIKNNEELIYLNMLSDRNLMSHTYRAEMSKEIFKRIDLHYRSQLNDLLKDLKLRIEQ